MQPHDPLQPYPGEHPLSPTFGLIMLAVGALVFGFILFRLVREYRRRHGDDAQSDDSSSSE